MIPGSREGLRYELASGLLARSQRLLKGAGAKGREAYVVWVGEMERGLSLRSCTVIRALLFTAKPTTAFRSVTN